MMEDGLILEYDIIEAKMKKELKEAEAKASAKAETKAQRYHPQIIFQTSGCC